MTDPVPLWAFLPLGYILTVAIKTPVLLAGLSGRHPLPRRLFAGAWLTACTYPVVVLVLPQVFDLHTQRGWYLLAAETFAPVAEVALFLTAFGAAGTRGEGARDAAAVVLANLASFLLGELGYWLFETLR